MYLQRWHGWSHMKLLTSQHILCTPYTMSLHAKPHSQGVCKFSCNPPPALLAEWLGSLCATAVTWGWNGYRNKSQHRQLTLEKKILLPLMQGFKPMTFQSWIQSSNHWAIPAPQEILRILIKGMDLVEDSGLCQRTKTILSWLTVTAKKSCGMHIPVLSFSPWPRNGRALYCVALTLETL